MHALLAQLIAREHARDMRARADRQRLIRSTAAAQSGRLSTNLAREIPLMTIARRPEATVPDAQTPASGGGSGFGRILVPIRSASDAAQTLAVAARLCSTTSGLLHVVHVRIYDPPVRGAGRFYPQTRTEAEAVIDEALPIAWGYGLRATTAVVAAPRAQVASAIARQASAWHADVIVMSRRPGLALCRLVLGSVPDQVMLKAHCPVLAVRPSKKAARSAGQSRREQALRRAREVTGK